MKQQCVLCGIEVGWTEEADRDGITLTTNAPADRSLRADEPLLILIGLWDQNKQARVDFCGSCLIDRLLADRPVCR